MKRPLVALILIPLGLWGAFVLPGILAANPGFWNWRSALVVLSGVFALWWVSAGTLLASRPAWLEKRFGLDKLYALHKNLGIGAGVFVFLHWLAEWLPKKLAKAGWLERPVRGPKPPETWWVDWAKDIGEWTGYILVALVLIALIKRLPYRYFHFLHRIFGLIFVAGAFHGLILMPNQFWLQPLGWLTAAMAALALFPALLSVAGRIGRSRQFSARIERLDRHSDQVLEIVCRPENWPGHGAGQFLFAHFGHAWEGAHPFTIASAWNPEEGTLTLAVKSLGDYTRTLPERLTVGAPLTLEGPYGRFDFSGKAARQIWVAGGIGVTPFYARLEQLAKQGGGAVPIDFFYAAPRNEAGNYAHGLEALCERAGVRLHRRETDRQGPIPSEEIAVRVESGTALWFCGPAAWAKALARQLAGAGLPSAAFHREIFEFR